MTEKNRRDLSDSQAYNFKQGLIVALVMFLVCIGALYINFKALAMVSGGITGLVLLAVICQAVRHDLVKDD